MMNLLFIIQIVIFVLGSAFIIFISHKSFLNIKVHGFYRFFVFEFTLALVLLNVPYWINNPASLQQILSWCLLIISIYLLVQGVLLLKKIGASEKREGDSVNYGFENTATLVTVGVFRYIRHPMYASLLFLCLGALLKNISVVTALLAVLIILFLIPMAKVEEKENINYFGKSYLEYMKGSKMFIPNIF